MAFIRTHDGDGPELAYTYMAQPVSSAPSNMVIHVGTTKLCLMAGQLEGEFYTGRSRLTEGGLHFTLAGKDTPDSIKVSGAS